MGFGGGGSSFGQEDISQGDDNSLSPEACYECKINGYPRKGRKRRSTNSTLEESLGDVQVTLSFSQLVCACLLACLLYPFTFYIKHHKKDFIAPSLTIKT